MSQAEPLTDLTVPDVVAAGGRTVITTDIVFTINGFRIRLPLHIVVWEAESRVGRVGYDTFARNIVEAIATNLEFDGNPLRLAFDRMRPR